MTEQRQNAVELDGVTRRFGDVLALDRVSVSVGEGEFFSLLGPSGCGKSTLLRIIAGLDSANSGVVRIDGQDASGIPAHRRPVNTVFQSYALFPHMDVAQNVSFGLRMKGVPREEIQQRVSRVIELVELQEQLHRRPSQLSGGQKQRVALARAIVNEPKVLLLDEPLAALDVKLRRQLQTELRSLQKRLGLTFMYVTHDQEEALALSDRIAVMSEGRIVQMGTPQSLYEHPRTRFVAQFLGACNLIPTHASRVEGDRIVFTTSFGELSAVAGDVPVARCTLGIRPEKVQLVAPGEGVNENCVRVQIEQVVYVGAETHYTLKAGDCYLRAERMNTEERLTCYQAGQQAYACLPAGALILLHE
jgi:spermidine/putrescine transport system ATP-binding protein